MKYNKTLTAVCLMFNLLTAPPIQAGSFSSLDAINQEQFRQLSETLGAATHYRGVTPAEPLGILGLDIGLEVSATKVDQDVFELASEGDYSFSSLLIPRLHVHKGLPLKLDVGAFLSAVPGTDLTVVGAELRYALVKGGVAMPAVALRASFSQIQGVTELDLNNTALELTMSKGFLVLTPYGGIGIVRSVSNPQDSIALEEETVDQKKIYVGLNVNLGFNFTVEADRTGNFTSYTAKAGIRF
ncbi:MAG: hypothetical protein V3U76_20490 [Granulosicoccus sp.]